MRYTFDLLVASCTSLSGSSRVCWFANKTWPFWRSPFWWATIFAAFVRSFTRFELADQDFSFTLITEAAMKYYHSPNWLNDGRRVFFSPTISLFRRPPKWKTQSGKSRVAECRSSILVACCFESLLLLTRHPWYRTIQTIMNNWSRLASRTGFLLFIYAEVRSCAEYFFRKKLFRLPLVLNINLCFFSQVNFKVEGTGFKYVSSLRRLSLCHVMFDINW